MDALQRAEHLVLALVNRRARPTARQDQQSNEFEIHTRAAVNALASDDASEALGQVLSRTLMGSSRGVADALLGYGGALERRVEWDRAREVYGTLVEYEQTRAPSDLTCEALRRLGRCHMRLAQLVPAKVAIDKGIALAKRLGDVRSKLHLRLCLADLAVQNREIADARTILDETLREASERHFIEVKALARHDRAVLAFHEAPHDGIISEYLEALKDYTTVRLRDRIERLLNDIALAAWTLHDETALAAGFFEWLYANAASEELRAIAALNLMDLGAELNDVAMFDAYQERLAQLKLSPALEAQFHLLVGQGSECFGRTQDARDAYRSAHTISEQRGLKSLERRIARVQAGEPDIPGPKSARTPLDPADRDRIVAAFGALAPALLATEAAGASYDTPVWRSETAAF